MQNLKKKWVMGPLAIFTEDGKDMKDIVAAASDPDIRQHIVDCHNACRNLARPELIPELVKLYRDIEKTPWNAEDIDNLFTKISKFVAQIEGE